MPETVSSLLFAWRNWFGKHLSTIWNMVLACLMWLVWQEHNTHTSENFFSLVLCLGGLVFGILRILFQFLNSYYLLTLVLELFVFVSCFEYSLL